MFQIWLITICLTLVTIAYTEDGNSLLDPKIHIDPKLRKALLKVLTDLEQDSTESQSPTDDKKKFPKKVFKVHAFAADQQSGETKEMLSSPTTTALTGTTTLQAIIDATDTNVAQDSNVVENSQDFGVVSTRATEISSDQVIVDPTNVDPTAFEPAATTKTDVVAEGGLGNDDGKVEEVQFFSAPLVAAFTVQQDERGIAHSVVPLYKDEFGSTFKNSKSILG